MGITLTATNSKYDFDMGYGGFFNLRRNIALALDKEFGENYSLLSKCITPKQFEENDSSANRIIEKKKLSENYSEVLDFLYESDCEGKVNYKTCGKILNLISNIDFGNKCFRYTAYSHNDYEEFKEFLKDCYRYHKNMRWY